MFKMLTTTSNDATGTVLRLALGLMIFPHGAQKLLGWFGGGGFGPTLDYFSQTLGVPALLAALVVFAEFFGGLALIIGFLSRLAAAGIGLVMLGAVLLVHAGNGFFMNWFGNQGGEGIEFHILAIAIALAVILRGSGALSVDATLQPETVAG
jgi:putative oxidoreductase